MQKRTNNPESAIGGRGERRGFTLVELMISIALVLVLVLGVSQVFRISSETLSAGQTISSMNRDIMGAKDVLKHDFDNVVKDGPFIIACRLPAAGPGANDPSFLSRAYFLSDKDGKAMTSDLNGDGIEGDRTVPYEFNSGHIYDHRWHRTDRIIMFKRGLFRRITGNDGSFTSANTTAAEAMVVLGHVAMPYRPGGQTTRYLYPGELGPASSNDSAQSAAFAANWVLGRTQILLKDPGQIPAGEEHIRRTPVKSNSLFVSPLGAGSAAGDGHLIQESRYDLAGTTIARFREDIAEYERLTGFSDWWMGMVYETGSRDEHNRIDQVREYRFECNPFVTKPLTSEAMAKTTPYFVGNVSQFIVEFAGDYLVQNNDEQSPTWGRVLGAGADGVIDYVVDRTDKKRPPVKRTRFYGMARDVNGDGFIPGSFYPDKNQARQISVDELVDVLPLFEIYNMVGTGGGYPPADVPLEVQKPGDGKSAGRAVWLDVNSQTFDIGRVDQYTGKYTVVWKNSTPPMIRILIRQDDPAGAVREGQWTELVYSLR